MSRTRLVVIIGALLTGLPCEGQPFDAIYGFPNVTTSSGTVAPLPVPSVPGLTCSTFSAFGVGANPSASGRFSFTGWPVGAADGADNYATYAAALSPFSYYEFCLTPQPGYTLSLAKLSFSVRRSGTGIRNYCVRTSADGFSGNVAAGTGTNTNLQVIPDDVFFWKYDNTSTSSDQRGSEVTFDNTFGKVTTPLRIRLYAWNSESAGGSFSVDDVKLSGVMIDSVFANGIQEAASVKCSLWTSEGFIVNDCAADQVQLFSMEGIMIRQWMKPPRYIPANEMEPGIYLALIRSGERQYRQKMLLRR